MKFRAGKRKAMAVGVAALAAAAFFVPPATAAGPSAAAASFCATGRVQAKVDGYVYTGWNSYRDIGTVFRGQNYSCNGWHVGRHYDVCGGGDAWLLVLGHGFPLETWTWGYAAAACFSDQ